MGQSPGSVAVLHRPKTYSWCADSGGKGFDNSSQEALHLQEVSSSYAGRSINQEDNICCLRVITPACKDMRHRIWLTAHRHMGITLRIGIIHTLSFGPFNGGQEENHSEHTAPHLYNLRGKRGVFFKVFFSNTNRSCSQFELEIVCYICCVFPVIIKNFRTVLLFFISFGPDIVHICKSPLVNGKVPSVIFSVFKQFISWKPFFVCSTAHYQIQVAGNIPARACFDPSSSFDIMLRLSHWFPLSLFILKQAHYGKIRCIQLWVTHRIYCFILLYCYHFRLVIKIDVCLRTPSLYM